MALFIPALNARSEAEFCRQARLLREWGAPWAQVDVADGILGVPRNAARPELAQRELAGIRWDVHLMVADVARALEQWLAFRPARITFHWEAAPRPAALLSAVRRRGSQGGLALAPESPAERVRPYWSQADLLLLVAVPPGRSGQPFDPRTLDRVRAVRQAAPALEIGVDGGVTSERVSPLLAAGATVIYAASAVFAAPRPERAYRELRRKVEGVC